VPNLQSFSLKDSEIILKKNNLRFEVLDSSKYNPNYPPLSVIDQSPMFNDLVKKNRKIYLTLNPKSYREISVPNVIQITQRNAETKLQAVGFIIGEKKYKNDIGKNMVLEIEYKGEKIDPGVLLPKNSAIDLILGNGKNN
jgi:beta-lactam-binding protein with PASTA domain